MRVSKCVRCGKENVEIHTCSPTKEWIHGFEYATVKIQNMLSQLRMLINGHRDASIDPERLIDDIQSKIDQIKESK